MGRPRKLKLIKVELIDPSKYPQFRMDPEHQFIQQEEERRLAEIIDICAKIHSQNAMDAARDKKWKHKTSKAS